jgi:hypothetical protein
MRLQSRRSRDVGPRQQRAIPRSPPFSNDPARREPAAGPRGGGDRPAIREGSQRRAAPGRQPPAGSRGAVSPVGGARPWNPRHSPHRHHQPPLVRFIRVSTAPHPPTNLAGRVYVERHLNPLLTQGIEERERLARPQRQDLRPLETFELPHCPSVPCQPPAMMRTAGSGVANLPRLCTRPTRSRRGFAFSPDSPPCAAQTPSKDRRRAASGASLLQRWVRRAPLARSAVEGTSMTPASIEDSSTFAE